MMVIPGRCTFFDNFRINPSKHNSFIWCAIIFYCEAPYLDLAPVLLDVIKVGGHLPHLP